MERTPDDGAAASNQTAFRRSAVFFALVLAPVVLISLISSVGTYRDMTETAMARRESVARLAAAVVAEKLGRLSDIALSLAARKRMSQLVAAGEWEQAADLFSDIVQTFPIIDRIFVADPAGTMQADLPALRGGRGKNFAHRDWYRGVTQGWQPYVSEVYQRASEPRFNVVAVAAPIVGPAGKPLGILVLQVRLDTLMAWGSSFPADPGSLIYIVDRAGRAAAHPRLPPQGEIKDLSGAAAVRRLLSGASGVERVQDPIVGGEHVAAFAPVPGFGWGVVVQQPAEAVFAARRRAMAGILAIRIALLLAAGLLAYRLFKSFRQIDQARSELAAANEALALSNKELEAFSYSVSHDLRAPLRSIDGFSQIVLEDYGDRLDEQGKSHLQRIRAGCQRMGTLIDDLINLSRVVRQEMRLETVDLAAIAGLVFDQLRRQDPERRVETVVPRSLPAYGDSGLLGAALENLLVNAWKFTSHNDAARIELGAENRAGERVYFVRDNGAGFDMAYASKLFGAFQRLHTQEEFPGTGIGLATVQRIIRRHGGRVWAEAEPGRGAAFYFTLAAKGGRDVER